MFKPLLRLIRSVFAYVKTLLAPKDPVVEIGPEGQTLLVGWNDIPEAKFWNDFNQIQLHRKDLPAPKAWIYCLAGPQQGEILTIDRDNMGLGVFANCDLSLTPSGFARPLLFRFFCHQEIKLVAEKGHYFFLNGKEVEVAQVIDYDHLNIAGNHFLVLVNTHAAN